MGVWLEWCEIDLVVKGCVKGGGEGVICLFGDFVLQRRIVLL